MGVRDVRRAGSLSLARCLAWVGPPLWPLVASCVRPGCHQMPLGPEGLCSSCREVPSCRDVGGRGGGTDSCWGWEPWRAGDRGSLWSCSRFCLWKEAAPPPPGQPITRPVALGSTLLTEGPGERGWAGPSPHPLPPWMRRPESHRRGDVDDGPWCLSPVLEAPCPGPSMAGPFLPRPRRAGPGPPRSATTFSPSLHVALPCPPCPHCLFQNHLSLLSLVRSWCRDSSVHAHSVNEQVGVASACVIS